MRDGISLRIPAGGAVHDTEAVGGEATYVRWDDGRIVRLIRGGDYAVGPDAPSRPIRICGVDARRFEVLTPAADAFGSFVDDEGTVQHLPPEHTPAHLDVIVVLEIAGRTIRIDWSVGPAHRGRHARAERAFFASIRCA